MGRLMDALCVPVDPLVRTPIETEPPLETTSTRGGRPERWTPAVLSPEDIEHAKKVVNTYGPKETYGESKWANKYRTFCALNNLDPHDLKSAHLCVGQANKNGLSIGSLCTYFENMERSPLHIKNSWKLRSTLRLGHADEDQRQPRQVRLETNELVTIVNQLNGFDQAIAWLSFATGARTHNLMRLRFSQILLEVNRLIIEQRITKTVRERSKRRELSYLYEWSMAPPLCVKNFFENGAPEKLINAGLPVKYSPDRVATTLTYQLRKVSKTKLTSYVFRDHLEDKLESLEIPVEERERLMDHCINTSEAFYSSPATHPVKARSLKLARKSQTTSKKRTGGRLSRGKRTRR